MDNSNMKEMFKKGEAIQIVFYENDSSINHMIKKAIHAVMEHYSQPEGLADVVYGCVKELLINATRANLKRAFFKKNNVDINNMGEYVKGLSMLRAAIETREYQKYSESLHTLDLWVMFDLNHSDKGLRINVINNSKIIEVEETRIRMKLRKAMLYTDIAEFYDKEKDETEGAGMGIAILINLMKSAGLDPHLFRLWTKNETTIARMEIPFSEDFIPERNQ